MDGIFVVYQWNKLFAAFIFCFVFALLLLSWRLACRLPEFVEFLLPFMLTLIIYRLILLV